VGPHCQKKKKVTILASLPDNAPFLEEDATLQASSHPALRASQSLALVKNYGLLMGQIFSTNLGAD
jgi:hypothetical protein